MLKTLLEKIMNWYANKYEYMDSEFLKRNGKYDLTKYY